MLAETLSAILERRGVHYAWVVAGVTFFVMLATAAAIGMPGVLIKPLTAEFGWSTATISGPLALRFVLFGLAAPFAAALLARYGLRRVILAALALIAGGLGLAILGMHAVWEMWVLWGLVVGLGTGMTALVLGATVAGRWFSRRRGLVIGILTASSATGQLIFLPLAAWLAEHQGWRWALAPALLALLCAAILVLLLLRDRPEDIGLLPYGEVADPAVVRPAAGPAQAPLRAALSALVDAAGTRTFWVLFGTFFVCGLSTNGLIQTHFVPFCSDFGIAEVQAASVLAVIGGFDFIGTIASGWLSDRYDPRKLLFWYYGLRGLSLIYLPFSNFTFYGLSLFAVFYGLDWVATVPPTVRLAVATWGRERGPLMFGWVFAGHQLGAAVAAFGAGLSRDTLATYLPAFYVAGAACLIAAAAALLIRRPGQPIAPRPVATLVARPAS